MIPVAAWVHLPPDVGRVVFVANDGSTHVCLWFARAYEVVLLEDEYCKLYAKQ